MKKIVKAFICTVVLSLSAVSLTGCPGSTDKKSSSSSTGTFSISSSSGGGTLTVNSNSVTVRGNSHVSNGTYKTEDSGRYNLNRSVYDSDGNLIGIIQYDTTNKKWIGDF